MTQINIEALCVRANTLATGDFQVEPASVHEIEGENWLSVYQTDYDDPVCRVRALDLLNMPSLIALLWTIHSRGHDQGELWGRAALRADFKRMMNIES